MNDRSAPRLACFSDRSEMEETLASVIAGRLSDAVAKLGRASFVATGGTTPLGLYDRLAQKDLPWDLVTVTLSDERWVPNDDARSNERMVRTHLLTAHATAARFIPFKSRHASPHAAELEAGAAVASAPRPFDMTLLGMGADGHIASLFPGATELSAGLDLADPALVRAITPPGVTDKCPRLSLTLRAILDSRVIAILICGRDKREAYEAAVAGEDVFAMPVRALLRYATAPIEVYWSP